MSTTATESSLKEEEDSKNKTIEKFSTATEKIKKLLSEISATEGNIQEESEHESFSRKENKSPLTSKNMSPGAVKLRGWLNKLLKIKMTDGRSLVGTFLCTDRDANIILGSCSEYLPEDKECDLEEVSEEPRMLGLVMVPGKHIVSISIDDNLEEEHQMTPLTDDIKEEDVI